MKLTKSDVTYTSELAKLKFNDQKKESLAKDLSDILDYAAKINELDTEDIQPMTHVLENTNVFREDVVEPGLSIDAALQNAPEEKDRTFKVPKML